MGSSNSRSFSADTYAASGYYPPAAPARPRAYVYRADTAPADVPVSGGQKALETALSVKGVRVVEPAPRGYLSGCTEENDTACFESQQPDSVQIPGYRYQPLASAAVRTEPKPVVPYKNLTGFDWMTYSCGVGDPYCMRKDLPRGSIVTAYEYKKTAL